MITKHNNSWQVYYRISRLVRIAPVGREHHYSREFKHLLRYILSVKNSEDIVGGQFGIQCMVLVECNGILAKYKVITLKLML